MAEEEEVHWIPRGEIFTRRINSERIAKDPRIEGILHQRSSPDSAIYSDSSASIEQILQPQTTERGASEDDDANPFLPHRLLQSMFMSKRVPAILQISERLFCLSPACSNTLWKVFDPKGVSPGTWSEVIELIETLDHTIVHKFGEGICILDTGLIDAIKHVHGRELFHESFGGGQIAALPIESNPLPSIPALFSGCSTLASWLTLNPENKVLIIAPNHMRMAVYVAASVLYCSNEADLDELKSLGNKIISWYEAQNELAEQSNNLVSKLQRALAPVEPKDYKYFNGFPRPPVRLVADFASLIHKRDTYVRALEEASTCVPGATIFPDTKELYIERIVLMPAHDANSMHLRGGYRPYFVLQDSKRRVIYSSMVHGVYAVHLPDGPHTFLVDKIFSGGDFFLRMYHLPLDQCGELIFESRLHSALLSAKLVGERTRGSIVLRMRNGDFDAVSSSSRPLIDFALQLTFATDRESGMLPIDSPRSITASGSTSTSGTEQQAESRIEDDVNQLALVFPEVPREILLRYRLHHTESTDPVGATANEILQAQEQGSLSIPADAQLISCISCENFDIMIDTRTQGLVKLLKVEIFWMRTSTGQSYWPSFLVAAPNSSGQRIERHSINGIPDILFERLQEAGEAEETIHIIRDETNVRPARTPTLAAGWELVNSEFAQLSQQRHRTGGIPNFSRRPRVYDERGAPPNVIQQLPQYPYKPSGDPDNEAECLICQEEYEEGEILKTLPCFHKYHKACIDNWLQRNAICPVCQQRLVAVRRSTPLV